MFPYLNELKCLLAPGILLQRSEVIRRYRLLQSCNEKLLRLLCTTDFYLLGQSDEGEMFFA